MSTPASVPVVNPVAAPRSVFLPQEDGRTKTLNATTGVQVIKGGQNIDESIVDAITASYANLVNSPVVATVMVILLIAGLAESNNANGPFEVIQHALESIVADVTESVFVRNSASIVLFLVNILVKFKLRFICVGLFWIPYFAKPSNNNMHISVLLTALAIFRRTDIISDILLSQVYFLYTQVRTPRVRMILMIVGVIVFVIGVANVKEFVKPSGLRVVDKPVSTKPAPSRRIPSATPAPGSPAVPSLSGLSEADIAAAADPSVTSD